MARRSERLKHRKQLRAAKAAGNRRPRDQVIYGLSEPFSHVAFDSVAFDFDFYGQHSDDDFDLPTETEGRSFGAVVRFPDEILVLGSCRIQASPLLKLPSEVIIGIASYLPNHDRVCFALACKPLLISCLVTQKRDPLRTCTRWKRKLLAFIAKMMPLDARGLPDVESWKVCARCCRLRPRPANFWVKERKKFLEVRNEQWSCRGHVQLMQDRWSFVWRTEDEFIERWTKGNGTICPQCALLVCPWCFDNPTSEDSLGPFPFSAADA